MLDGKPDIKTIAAFVDSRAVEMLAVLSHTLDQAQLDQFIRSSIHVAIVSAVQDGMGIKECIKVGLHLCVTKSLLIHLLCDASRFERILQGLPVLFLRASGRRVIAVSITFLSDSVIVEL